MDVNIIIIIISFKCSNLPYKDSKLCWGFILEERLGTPASPSISIPLPILLKGCAVGGKQVLLRVSDYWYSRNPVSSTTLDPLRFDKTGLIEGCCELLTYSPVILYI